MDNSTQNVPAENKNCGIYVCYSEKMFSAVLDLGFAERSFNHVINHRLRFEAGFPRNVCTRHQANSSSHVTHADLVRKEPPKPNHATVYNM